jgi:predicted alpha/beta superfamily hydrolase
MQFGEGFQMVKNSEDLAARLRNHASGADVSFIEFEGQTHGTVLPAFFTHALQFVLPTTAAAVGH